MYTRYPGTPETRLQGMVPVDTYCQQYWDQPGVFQLKASPSTQSRGFRSGPADNHDQRDFNETLSKIQSVSLGWYHGIIVSESIFESTRTKERCMQKWIPRTLVFVKG